MGQNLDFREVFDVAVARAVAEMRVLGKMYIYDGDSFMSDS